MPFLLTPEQIAEMNRELDALWLGRSFGALVEDARYFYEQMKNACGDDGRHARATVVFSVAAIEAATNDGLAAIDDLMTDGYGGSECRYEKPWVDFWNRSGRTSAPTSKPRPVWAEDGVPVTRSWASHNPD